VLILAIQICQRNCKVVLPLSESECSQLNKERKQSYAQVANVYGKNKSTHETVKEEKEIHAILLSHLKVQNLEP
jgi:hypothetical protein